MSLTHTINANLPYISLVCVVCLLGILFHRIVRIFASALVSSIIAIQYQSDRLNSVKSTLQKYAHNSLYGHALSFLVTILNAALNLVIVAFRAVLFLVYILLPIVVVALLLIIVNERWADFLVFIIDTFNTSVGTTLRTIILFPLQILDIITSNVVPIFNLLVYIIIQAPLQIIFWIAQGQGKTHFISFLQNFAASFPIMAEKLSLFISNHTAECTNIYAASNVLVLTENSKLCTNISGPGALTCSYVSVADQAEACFDKQNKEIDLYSGLVSMQQAFGHGIMTVCSSCDAIALIANVTLFPLIDPFAWRALDRITNSIMGAFISAPMTAIQRCKLAGGLAQRPSMCTPDFGPPFDFMAEASMLIGKSITNWLDVLYLFIFDTKSGSLSQACNIDLDFTDAFNDEVKSRILGSNATVLVRMTPSTFALTDGFSAIYVEHDGPIRKSYSPQSWPIPVNPKYGIARTILPIGNNVKDDGVGLLGCVCNTVTLVNAEYSSSSAQITCAITTKSGNSWILPVEWSLSTESQLLTCSRLRIVVQSLKKPHQRVLTSEIKTSKFAKTCEGRECLIGDVAVYVIPVCGSNDKIKALACLPEKYFTRGTCFPYCMAIHTKNEMKQPIRMRGAAEWEQGVVIANRDCIPTTKMSNSTPPQDDMPIQTVCTIQSEQAVQNSYSSKTLQLNMDTSQSTSKCSFSSICTTSFIDKTILDDYKAPIIGSIPIIRDNSPSTMDGVRLTLDLQPLVVAGEVQMRKYERDGEFIVDFPTIVGNQYNEFTIEFFSQGIPVTQERAPVPSQEHKFVNKYAGQLYLPQALEFVQPHIPFSPAALTSDSLWYATNPSYEWMYAMINYCSTKGAFVQTQLMILSSYSPMRLWRVQYQNTGCYVAAPDFKRICSPNVANSFVIDPEMDIPIMDSNITMKSTSLMDMCLSGNPKNLWVESMEDYDEYNIAVVVRRGTMDDMGYLLDDLQKTSLSHDTPFMQRRGSSVFYFVSKLSFKVKQNIPWTINDYFALKNMTSPSSSIFRMTCPKLRVLPDIGKFVGHSLAAVFHLLRVPVNFILNPFAVQEVLVARSRSICPDNSLKHSALDDCGMKLFSLANYFESMYQANEAFWNLMSWLTFQILGGTDGSGLSKEALFFNQFLQGGIVLGDASKLISIFEITRSIEFLDTGIEQVMFKTRRRLLEDDDDDDGGGGGDEGGGSKSATGMFGHLTGILTNGLGSLTSMTTSFASAVAGNLFSGANIGMILAGQDPIMGIIGTSLTIPPLSWAQLTYEGALPIILDILAHAQNGDFTFKPIWVHLYDTMDKYDEIVHERHKRACTGYRLMLGYGSALGKAVYYNCLSAAEMPRGVWTVALTIFVDMNLYRCLCVNPVGQEYKAFAYQNCEYLISNNRKGLWQNILSTRNVNEICQDYSSSIEAQLYGAFNLWISHSLQAAESMTSFLDELFIHKSHATDCNNINSNPTAIVLSPIPLDHFHVCAKTSSCRLRCEDSFLIFEAEYNRVKAMDSVEALRKTNYFSHEVESPFFNRYDSDWTGSGADTRLQSQNKFIRALASQHISAIQYPLHACRLRCGENTGYMCITALTEYIDVVDSAFEVNFFCLPNPGYLLATIFNTGRDIFFLNGINELVLQEGIKITHFEFSIQNTSASAYTYLYMYAAKLQAGISLNNQVSKTDSYQIYLWRSDGNGGAASKLILSSADIMSNILNPTIEKNLFGREYEVVQSEILSCGILSTVEVFTGLPHQFAIIFSFNVQMKIWLKLRDESEIFDFGNANAMTSSSENYLLYGVLYHCEQVLVDLSQPNTECTSQINYYVPCSYCQGKGNPDCLLSCSSKIDKVIEYANQGSLMHIGAFQYLYLPSNEQYTESGSSSFVELNAQLNGKIIEINPYIGVNERFRETVYKIDKYSQETISTLGSWTRSDIFATTLISYKPVRDVRAYRNPSLHYYQVDGGARDTSIASEWLQQARVQYSSRGYAIQLKKSAITNRTSTLISNCGIHSCEGCIPARLRLFCHAAVTCSQAKCVGTVVQTRNVFCGLGSVFEKMSVHATLTWRAIYMSGVEIGLILMRGLAGEIITEVTLKFPTDQFYTLVCSCKDTYASMIGLAMSLIQMLSTNLFGNSGLVQGLSLSGDNEDIGVLMGEKTLKTASVGQLFFNMLTGSTLIPVMALHKFLICTVNATMMENGEDGSLTIEFEDVAMDTTWLACSQVSGFSKIINSIDVTDSLQSSVDIFADFALSLLSGIGETLLYALQLSFDSSVDFFIGLTWSLEDIVETFNMKKCKVPNYALRYVLWCACNDTQYRIPQQKRLEGRDDGALWCVGTMSINLVDGTPNAIVYNPYSLDVLSDGIKGVTQYIECLSNTYDIVSCEAFRLRYDSKLQILINQGVEPIAVWAKCKANYNNGVWDSGAGAIFMPSILDKEIARESPFLNVITRAAQNQWIDWAMSISAEFLLCMQEPSRLQIDYSTCMREYFNVRWKQTPNAYFLYEKQYVTAAEPPDACHVFSGIAKAASFASPLERGFNACILEQENMARIDQTDQQGIECTLNPTVWSNSKPQKLAVAKFHGTVPPWKFDNVYSILERQQSAQKMYKYSLDKLNQQWKKFNDSFFKDAKSLDVALFSADGDFIHDFFDCMYLGPYTRMDILPCDANDVLDCPFYARDEFGGKTRNFTKCFGIDLMHNDTLPPYTCGSKTRRSLIKYFYREIITKQNLAVKITDKIFKEIDKLYKNYTSQSSLGCYDATAKTCSLQACNLQNGFSPCLDTNFIIDGNKMSKFLLEHILSLLPEFYQFSMQDSAPWSLYANKSGPNGYPFQWKAGREIAEKAIELGHTAPDIPIVNYGEHEVFNMPLYNASDKERRLGSIWSTCMSLLAQPSLTVPIENKTFGTSRHFQVPVGLWEAIITYSWNPQSGEIDVDWTNVDDLEIIVRRIVKAAAKSHSPFIWHRHRKHAPSHSNFCKKDQKMQGASHVGKMHVSDLKLEYQKDGEYAKLTVAPEPNLHLNFYGYLERTIGESHLSCICGKTSQTMGIDMCEISAESCNSFRSIQGLQQDAECGILKSACDSSRHYFLKDVDSILTCLRKPIANVRCPEFGLSDTWGFFPVDCTTQECDIADAWVSTGDKEFSYEAMRFLNEGKGGIRLPNYKHHNATYHTAMNHKEQQYKPYQYAMDKCVDVSELTASEESDNDMSFADAFLARMFPVVQLVYESHVTASCSRFLIEMARLEVLEFIESPSLELQILEAMKWKQKCETKIRHFIACNTMGLYFDVPPPSDWRQLAEPNCGIRIENANTRGNWFLSPWCVLIDQESRKIFDAHKCAHNIPNRYPDSASSNYVPYLDLSVDNIESLDCSVFPSPFLFMRENEEDIIPLSMVFTYDKRRLIEHEDWIQELLPEISLETLLKNSYAAAEPKSDHVSHIVDWWPDEVLEFPSGFHVSSATDPSEIAPVLFDSQFLFDPDTQSAFYVHTSLRNNSLLHENLGACGICRMDTIGMPMYESNTNRICTRFSKHAKYDVPTYPVYKLKHAGGDAVDEWPFTNDFIEQNFYEEYCAESSFDIPWKHSAEDILSQTAGGIAGWSSIASLNSLGFAFYNPNSDPVFPPKTADYKLHEINEDKIFTKEENSELKWGPCEDVVSWSAGIACDTQDTSQMCPDYQSTCLKFNESTTRGICFPTITYASSVQDDTSTTRYPCFASFHCPENFVCLADGGCSPLYLHVWNNERYPIEFSVIADECGFNEENHPYTQNLRGASPWENVPDILHVHGFCAHRNWYSYRHAINVNMCPLEQKKHAFLRCDPNSTFWPWIFETFDKTRPTDTNVKTLSEEKLLKLRPHACDQQFMHLRNPLTGSGRLKVCSGFQGQQNPMTSEMNYRLQDLEYGWSGLSLSGSMLNNNSEKAWWMRTYNEEDNKVDIGVLDYSSSTNYPLGFLGADRTSASALYDMTYSNTDGKRFRFFKCTDRYACSMPLFQYNGLHAIRADPNRMDSNHSEMSIRYCGPMGYRPRLSSGMLEEVCALDLNMFPLLISLLWSSNAERGCKKLLWEETQEKIDSMKIIFRSSDILMQTKLIDLADPEVIICENTYNYETLNTYCIYKPRTSSKLMESSETDHVSKIKQRLNNLILDSPTVIAKSIKNVQKKISGYSASFVYENVNECANEVQTILRTTQTKLQKAYSSLGTSGLYLNLKVSLFEISLSWMHHVWLVSVLSTIDARFSLPNVKNLIELGVVEIPLWTDKSKYCDDANDLASRSLLLSMICNNWYLENTFWASSSNAISLLKERVRSRAKTDIMQNLYINRENINIKCYERVKWKCDEMSEPERTNCYRAWEYAHNTTSRRNQYDHCPTLFYNDPSPDFPMKYYDPCQNSDLFALDKLIDLPPSFIDSFGIGGISSSIRQIQETLKEALLSFIDEIIEDIDYVSEVPDENGIFANVMKILPLKLKITSSTYQVLNFDFYNWFQTEVCPSSFASNENSICKWQEDIPISNPCLYPYNPPPGEYEKFVDNDPFIVQDERNVIKVEYTDDTVEYIDVCKLIETNEVNKEYCVVQFLGNRNQTVEFPENDIPCQIRSIHVPQGIEVQAFTFEKNKDAWLQIIDNQLNPYNEYKFDSNKLTCTPSDAVKSCTWRYNPPYAKPVNSWWYGDKPTSGDAMEILMNNTEAYMDHTKTLSVDFSGMEDWWKSNQAEWDNEGCGHFSAACSLNFRLEHIPTLSRAVCTRGGSPSCDNTVSNPRLPMRSYATASSTNIDNRLLYRCAPCTRAEPVLADGGLFGCHMRDSSNNPISNISSQLSQASISRYLPYLEQASSIKEIFPTIQNVELFYSMVNTRFADELTVQLKLQKEGKLNPVNEESMAKRSKLENEEKCTIQESNNCIINEVVDLSTAKMIDQLIWNEAVQNPNRMQTMVCNDQRLKESDFSTCNSKADIRRTQLKEFVDSQYRKHNGVWFNKVQPNHGIAWQANVAHPKVNMFSIMFTSSERNEREVTTQFVLGNAPCSSKVTQYQDRICLESMDKTELPFEPMHPWIGGDFNPFEGKRGHDECMILNSIHTQTPFSDFLMEENLLSRKTICPCRCEPDKNCRDLSGIFNYSDRFIEDEFPETDEVCSIRAFPQTYTMSANDESNLCSFVQKPMSTSTCVHKQGLLGGFINLNPRVDNDQFHSKEGVGVSYDRFLIQSMYEDFSSNGLWTGKTLLEEQRNEEQYAFLKMPRHDIHPAHIAFSMDKSKTGSPLLLKSIALLPYNKNGMKFPTLDNNLWLGTLERQWLQDSLDVLYSYPHINSYQADTLVFSSMRSGGHWSCPFRVVSFWGNANSDAFSPKIPNPLLSKILRPKLNGAHPLVQLKGIRHKLHKYKTTNGICFYESSNFEYDNTASIYYVNLADANNPCGLKQMLWHLNEQTYTMSRVMNHFHIRCNHIIDFPGLNATMRNGEVINDPLLTSDHEKCGVLHRLTPFLMRTKGNAAVIRRHRYGLSTKSEGGDCHMGRAFLHPIAQKSQIAGKHCSLISKTWSSGTVRCTGFGNSRDDIILRRSVPQTIEQIKTKKFRYFKNEIMKKNPLIMFKGPGAQTTIPAEVSYGLHMSISLARMLADDLKYECEKLNHPDCILVGDWKGRDFLKKYASDPGSIVQLKKRKNSKYIEDIQKMKNVLYRGIIKQNPGDTLSAYLKAKIIDDELWSTENWTWSYYMLPAANNNTNSNETFERAYMGTVDKHEWRKNRFKACNASHHKYFTENGTKERIMDYTTMRVSLCEPAPTQGLQTLCQALLQFRQEITLINCQIMGNNDCLYSPGMFYMPYEWSTTNQQFSTQRVHSYYSEILSVRFPNESIDSVCPARNDIESNMIKLSIETRNQCPANQLEFLKDTLNTIKGIGKDLLYMAYCLLMFVVNIVAILFEKSGEAASAMQAAATKYAIEFFSMAAKIIVPILNAFVSLLFGTSSAGQIISDIIVYLCEIYNWVMNNIIVYLWCTLIMPQIYLVIQFLKAIIGTFSSEVNNVLDTIWNVLGGGHNGFNIPACIGRLKLNIVCKAPSTLGSFNASQYRVQPLATKCWVDSKFKNGYSNVFGGSSEYSYLSCTLSDTCARDAMSFDDYHKGKDNVIPCSSCPDVEFSAGFSQKFGCNTFIKRCTCSTTTQVITECMSNRDCQILSDNPICSMASTVDRARTSFSTTECSACGSMGQTAMCIMDGVGTTGVCSCGALDSSSFLSSCSEDLFGSQISLLDNTQQCFISTNQDITAFESPVVTIDFNTLAIGPCALGVFNPGASFCLRVTLPRQSRFSDFTRTFIVITKSIAPFNNLVGSLLGTTRRRLLSYDNDLGLNMTDVQVMRLAHDIIMHNITTACSDQAQSRMEIKQCIHWKYTTHILEQHLYMQSLKQDPDLLVDKSLRYMFNYEFMSELYKNPVARSIFVNSHDGAFAGMLDYLFEEAVSLTLSNASYLWSANKTECRECNASKNGTFKASRRLLQVPSAPQLFMKLPSQSCYALDKPFKDIHNAFWDTVAFYNTRTMQDINKVTWYKYPPIQNASIQADGNILFNIALQLLSLSMSGGYTPGEQILNSFTVNMSKQESIENNFFTGQRFSSDLAKCNYTTLTFGPGQSRELLPWALVLGLFIFLFASCCSSSTIVSWILWFIVFPVLLFWSVYNVSPLCWPMIPPKLPHDLVTEISYLVPSSINIPYFLIHEDCLSLKRVTNGNITRVIPHTKNIMSILSSAPDKSVCFKKCSEDPFLMKSWQDPLAWWVCELDADICKQLASMSKGFPVFKDFASSASYFADVLKIKHEDEEFALSHRFCALFTSHQIILSFIIAFAVLMIAPTILQSIVQIFMGAVLLVVQASNAEITE